MAKIKKPIMCRGDKHGFEDGSPYCRCGLLPFSPKNNLEAFLPFGFDMMPVDHSARPEDEALTVLKEIRDLLKDIAKRGKGF